MKHTHNRDELIELIREHLLKSDITVLNVQGCADNVMELLAAEHGARCETLAKAIEPTMGRAILLMLAKGLMAAASQISDATIIEGEIIHA